MTPRDHRPLDYRPEGADRNTGPADVCDTCSDFTADLAALVPVSFCEVAKVKSAELYAFFQGAPKPEWMD